MEGKGHEKSQTGFAASLDDYIKDKKWKGVKFSLGNITGEGLEYYLRFGVLDNKGTDNVLNKHRLMNLELCLPEEKVLQLVLNSLTEEDRMDYQTGSHPKENCRERLEQICNSYPYVLQKTVGIIIDDWSEFVRVEDRPMDEVVAWMLNIGTGFDRLAAKFLLKESLHLKGNEKEALLGEYKHLDGDEATKEWFMNLRLPSEAGARFGAGKLYIYEKGVLGYAVISPDRKARFGGDSMNPEIIKWINDVMENHNIVNDAGFLLFDTPINEKEHRILDAQKGTVRTFRSIINTAGDKVLLDEEEREFHGSENRFLDITGRITDIKLKEGEKPTVRCKIDGIQQLARPVSEALFYNYKENRITGLELAEKCFAARLIEYQQRQNQGIKR